MTDAKPPSAILSETAATVPPGSLRDRLFALAALVLDAEREAERFRAAVKEAMA